MLTSDKFIVARTAYLQQLCLQNGIAITGRERIYDLERLLVAAGINPNIPSPVPKIYAATGTTNNPGTTATFASGGLVLPDPQVSFAMNSTQIARVTAVVCLSASGASNVVRLAQLVYSTNGGSSWTPFGTVINITAPGNQIIPATLDYYYQPSQNVNVTFGIRIGNVDGTTTITAANNQRSITAVVFG